MFGEKRDAILSPRDEGEISPEVMRRIERDLRHTCATLLLQQGTHPTLVQHLLGHASVSITLDRYSHRLPSMGDQTARTMERAGLRADGLRGSSRDRLKSPEGLHGASCL
jgi:integrase